MFRAIGLAGAFYRYQIARSHYEFYGRVVKWKKISLCFITELLLSLVVLGMRNLLLSVSILHTPFLFWHRLPYLALSSGHSSSVPGALPVGRDPAISHANMDHHHGNLHNKQNSPHQMACLQWCSFWNTQRPITACSHTWVILALLMALLIAAVCFDLWSNTIISYSTGTHPCLLQHKPLATVLSLILVAHYLERWHCSCLLYALTFEPVYMSDTLELLTHIYSNCL